MDDININLINKLILPSDLRNNLCINDEIIKLVKNITQHNLPICGVMIESNINEGKQKYNYLEDNPKMLKYGISITDSCIGFSETEKLLKRLNDYVAKRNN